MVSRGPSSTSRPRARGDAPGRKRRLGRVVDGLLDRVDHALRLLARLALALAARRLGVDELARARDLEVARRARVADLLDGYIVAELLLDRLSERYTVALVASAAAILYFYGHRHRPAAAAFAATE